MQKTFWQSPGEVPVWHPSFGHHPSKHEGDPKLFTETQAVSDLRSSYLSLDRSMVQSWKSLIPIHTGMGEAAPRRG